MPIAVPNRTKSPRRRAQNDSEEPESPGKPIIEEDGWTIDTFVNRPIKKGALPEIVNLVDKLKEVVRKMGEGLEQATETAKAIEGASPDDPSLEEVVEIFQRSLEQRKIVQIKIEVLESIMEKIRDGDEEMIDRVFTEESEDKIGEYMTKSDRAKFKDDELYRSFRQEIWETSHFGMACPPMSTWLKAGSNEDSDDDDGIEVGGMTQDYICRISRGPLIDAVSSTVCKHYYSEFAIMALLQDATQKRAERGKPKSIKCPFESCNAIITAENLRPDKELQKKADQYQKRKAQVDEESDDDVVDVDRD